MNTDNHDRARRKYHYWRRFLPSSLVRKKERRDTTPGRRWVWDVTVSTVGRSVARWMRIGIGIGCYILNGIPVQVWGRILHAASGKQPRFTDQVTGTDGDAQCAANTIGHARSGQTGLGVRVSWFGPAYNAAEKKSFEDGKNGIFLLLYPPVSVIVRCDVRSNLPLLCFGDPHKHTNRSSAIQVIWMNRV